MKRTNTARWLESQKRWQINVQKDGVRRSFTSSTPGRNGQREANKKADDWLDGNLINPNIKVSKLYPQWIDVLKQTTSKSHWIKYVSMGNKWILPRIGSVQLGKLNEGHLQSVIDAMQAAGLARKTQRNMRACLAAFVKYARINKATTLIIDTLSVAKSSKVGERTILQPNDIKKLFSSSETIVRGKPCKEFYINAYRFQVATGLRPGEVLGLQWSDVHGSNISLKRSINHYKEITTGKNDNARRVFALTPLASSLLEDQKEHLSKHGTPSKYIFCDEHGEVTKQFNYTRKWNRYRDHNGISPATPYELRHTFVSIVKQLPDGLLKPLVGHSKDMDTYGVYSHEVSGDKEQTAVLVQDIFSNILK